MLVIPFIVDVVTHSGHNYVVRTSSRSERESVTHTLSHFCIRISMPPISFFSMCISDNTPLQTICGMPSSPF